MDRDTQRIFEQYSLVAETVDPAILNDHEVQSGRSKAVIAIRINNKTRSFTITKIDPIPAGGGPDEYIIWGNSLNDESDLQPNPGMPGTNVVTGGAYRIIDDTDINRTIPTRNNLLGANKLGDGSEDDWKTTATITVPPVGGPVAADEEGEREPETLAGWAGKTGAGILGKAFTGTQTGQGFGGGPSWTDRFGKAMTGISQKKTPLVGASVRHPSRWINPPRSSRWI